MPLRSGLGMPQVPGKTCMPRKNHYWRPANKTQKRKQGAIATITQRPSFKMKKEAPYKPPFSVSLHPNGLGLCSS